MRAAFDSPILRAKILNGIPDTLPVFPRNLDSKSPYVAGPPFNTSLEVRLLIQSFWGAFPPEKLDTDTRNHHAFFQRKIAPKSTRT